jgi:hypothetical protein
VREAAGRLGYSHRDIVSGAGHDACWMNRVVPSAMIFCPCVDGLSHNEDETITPEWAKAGTDVLLHAVLQTAEIVWGASGAECRPGAELSVAIDERLPRSGQSARLRVPAFFVHGARRARCARGSSSHRSISRRWKAELGCTAATSGSSGR